MRIILWRCDEATEPASSGSCRKRKSLDKEVEIGPSPAKQKPEKSSNENQKAVGPRAGNSECRLGAESRTLAQKSIKEKDIKPHINTNTAHSSRPSSNETPKQNRKLDIKILQLNMGRSKQVAGEIRSLVGVKKIDILLLQEPRSRSRGGTHWCEGMDSGTKVIATRKEQPWAAIAITNPDIEVLSISQLSTSYCVYAEIIAPNLSFYVVSPYFKYGDDKKKHLHHLEKVLKALRGKRILLGMDSNAQSSLWGPNGTDDDGAKINALLQAFGVDVLNDPAQPPTCEHRNGDSYIDVTVSSQSMNNYICEWKVWRDWSSSDHNSIEIRVGTPDSGNDRQAETNWFNISKADWKKFNESLVELASFKLEPPALSSAVEVEKTAEELTKVIIMACERSMPRKRRFRKSNPWWNPELTKEKRKVSRLKEAFRREKDDAKRAEKYSSFQTANSRYKKLIRQTRTKSWRDFVSEVGNEEPFGFVYKHAAGKIRTETAISAVKTADGTTMGMRETAQVLLNAHIPDDKIDDDTEELKSIRKSVEKPPDTEDTAAIVLAEVKLAVKSFKN